jgi:glycyl-tRNA synthetase (class II)
MLQVEIGLVSALYSAVQEVIPHVIEPALGGTRLLLAVLCDALVEETVAGGKDGGGEARTVLKLHEDLAPFKLAVCPFSPLPARWRGVFKLFPFFLPLQVLPLMNKGPLADFASQLHHDLLHDVRCDFDASGSIG